MKSEMDVLNLDERQRLGWLLANRALIFLIGIVWLCMIGWELIQNRLPYFLIIMVPVFALIRLFFYLYYTRKSKGAGIE
jgi:hypothetical protein